MPARTGLRTSRSYHATPQGTAAGSRQQCPRMNPTPAKPKLLPLLGAASAPHPPPLGRGSREAAPHPQALQSPLRRGPWCPRRAPTAPGLCQEAVCSGPPTGASRSSPLCCLSLLLCCSGCSGGNQARAPPIALSGVGEQRAEGHCKRVMDMETRAQSGSWGGGAQEATGVQGEAPPTGVGSPSSVTSQ